MTARRFLPRRSKQNKNQRRRRCDCRIGCRRPPQFETLEPRHLLSGNPVITATNPSGWVTEPADSVWLDLSEPVLGSGARDATNYILTHLGADQLPGGGDDQDLRILPRYVDGTTQIEITTIEDLTTWSELDYGFPAGIHGDWQVEPDGSSVVQAANGGATFFISGATQTGGHLLARIVVEDAGGDDDYLGVVFGLSQNSETGLPDEYYLLAWKGGGAGEGLTLAKVTGTGTLGNRPDLYTLDPADPHLEILATGPAVGWQESVVYDFQVDYESDGSIDVAIREEDGTPVWTLSTTDPAPLGDGTTGFYNLGQASVRYTNLGGLDGLPEGAYQLIVHATDPGIQDLEGNPLDGDGDGTGGDDFVTTFGINAYPAAVTLDLDAASDSGASDSDNLTNDTSPTFNVTVNEIGLVSIDFDGDLTPDDSYYFTAPGTHAFTASYSADDTYSVSVDFQSASDGLVQDTLDVTIDTAAPVLQPGDTTADAPWSQYALTFDEPIDPATFTLDDVTLDELPGDPITLGDLTGAGTDWTVGFPIQLTAGNYVFHVGPNLTDLAGNPMAAQAERIVALNPDVLGPVVTNVTLQPSALAVTFFDIGGLDATTVENTANYTLLASGGDGTFGDANEVDVSGQISSIAFEPTTGVATVSFSGMLPDERYRLSVNGTTPTAVQDLSGNPLLGGSDYVTTLDLDAKAAAVAIDLLAGSDSGVSQTDNITNVTQPQFDVFVNEAGLIEVDYNNDGTPEETRLVAAPGNYAFTAPVLSDAIYSVKARLVPAADTPVQSFLTLTIDTQAPTIPTTSHTAQAPWKQLAFAFDAPIAGSTLSEADITLLDPGSTPVTPFTLVADSGANFHLVFDYQVTPGDYTFSLGPNVTDVAGNPMTGPDGFTVTLIADVNRPYVISLSPVGATNQNFAQLTVTFNEPILAGSFTVADLSITSPAGPLDPGDLGVTPTGEKTFQIDLPEQSDEGAYTVQIGPDVTDLSSNAMTSAYQAVVTIDKTPPSVVGMVPSGVVGQVVQYVDITFDAPISQSTLTAADVVLTDPSASPLSIQSIQSLGGGVYRFHFAPQSANGTYSLTLGPDVLDPAGNPMVDAYAGQFGIALPDLAIDSTDPSALVAPSTGLFGQAIDVSWIVDNFGTVAAGAAWTDRVWLSTDAALDSGDVLLLGLAGANPLDAASQYGRTQSVTLPLSETSLEGTYYVLVETGAQSSLIEVTKTNNVLARPIDLTLPPLPDLVVSDVVG
ncbi:MAG: Ig-like domain-containing protein, partial [Pirellulales bacterium]|nr:Ig-like domain-containing protein [Pirellulales bacterium]